MDVQSAAPVNQKLITVNKQEADQLHQEAKQFQAQLQKQKEQFALNDDDIYYIVSSKFLSQWRDFAIAHTLQRYEPSPMNLDILQNGKLKDDLREGEDFQILSETLFRKFMKFQGIHLKRKAVTIGNQKRVPIYQKTFKYSLLLIEHLRAIDRNALSPENFQIKTIEASEEHTVNDLIEFVRARERFSYSKKMRIWKLGAIKVQDLFQHIKQEAKKNKSFDLKIKFLGKKIQDQKTKLGEFQLDQNQFFVVEAIDDYKKWYLTSGDQAKCQGCYQFASLNFLCNCKKVAYCSQQCKMKDRRFHLSNCEYEIMLEQKNIFDMKITQNSAKGRVGLSNLGNTCFMNSCLQCMSNTVPLTEYFIEGFFQNQINTVNPIGTKGKLAKAYAKFIKAMWCEENNVFSPYNIKSQVSKVNPIFSGYAQHDSQEFFSFLADGLHEDLNRIQKKPYVESIDSNGRPDQVVALQSWINYIKRNQSIIVDLMTGQYRSKVTCPDCNKESITFDPFTTVTLPIPQKIVNSQMFYLIYANMQKKTGKYYFTYEKVRANEWIHSASQLLQMAPQRFGLYVVTILQGIYKVGKDDISQILHKIQNEGKQMFLVEYSQEDMKIEDPIELPVRFAQKTSYDYNNLWFKFPFIFDKNSIKGIDIYKRVLKFLFGNCYIKKQGEMQETKSYAEYQSEMLEKRPFKLYLKYSRKSQRTYHKLEFKFQNQQQILDQNDIANFVQNQPQRDCQIDVRFMNRNSLDDFQFDKLKDFQEKMTKPKQKPYEDVTVSLDQCFQNLREVERLQKGNQWRCPQCKEYKQANKQLGIYKAPKILIIHLKRFKQKGSYRKQKNDSKVEFPMELNMKDYLYDPRPMSTYVQEAKKLGIYIEPKTNQPVLASQEPIYELYAVSNHFGGLGGGHYTAYAKNNGKWFEFNDSSVRACNQSYITGSGAYILFYKRKE